MQQNKTDMILIIAIVAALAVLSGSGIFPGGADMENLPWWSVLPFAGMLLSIALGPLFNADWWEKNMTRVSVIWAMTFFVPFLWFYGSGLAVSHLLETLVLDYLPFIILLFGLFAVSGGIVLRGSLKGKPSVNLVLLVLGTILASWIGTTGASMLMIRPLIRANEWREKKAHIILFFIFLVANMGGSLTPLGDPPLFLGFLRGVPFFWTMRLIAPLALNALILLTAYYLLDRHYYRKEIRLKAEEGTDSTGLDRVGAEGELPVKRKPAPQEPIKVEGLQNLIYLGIIIGAVILSGLLARNPAFIDPVTGGAKGITLFREAAHRVVLPFTNIIRDPAILLAAFLSVKTTPRAIRSANRFSWAPIKEVAVLFIGIFVTMIPALILLQAHGAALGLTEPKHFFWATGALSSFLDNAPTYLVFMTAAASLGATEGVATTVGTIAPQMLMAVSCGAVFMGAITYIGNAPNFMVRAIAEENKIKMPNFFGYMAIAILCLVPVFILDTLLFFS